MKAHTCCFSGHRRISNNAVNSIRSLLLSEIEKAIKNGIDTFCVGGALGFDTLAAYMVLETKQQFPNIKLRLILPCRTQYLEWTEKQIGEYMDILGKADSIEYVSDKYIRGCMHIRNRKLVDESCLCICYLTSRVGGTAYTVNYARKAEIDVINIADYLFQ